MKGVAPRTLQELCIEHLCINLDELLQVPRVLEFLEPKHRAILYYAAKRRGLLTNNLLRSFVNESDCWSSLNVSRTSVTESTLRDVLPLLPRLKCIDVSYCEHVTSSIFQQLVLFCPNLESISCSGLRVTKKEQLMQLRRMMPTIELDSCSLDSWEEMEEQAPWEGKLLQLRQLIWENIPIELYKWIQTHAPRVIVGTARAGTETERKTSAAPLLHGEELTEEACDFILSSVAQQDQGQVRKQEVQTPETSGRDPRTLLSRKEQIPIAERFRYAYILRSERLNEKYDKEKKRRRRKELRESGAKGAKSLVNMWLDGL